MSFAKVKGKLTSRIGRPVNYGPPKDVRERGGGGSSGKIIDEIWAEPNLNSAPPHNQPCDKGKHCWGDYAFCAQLIEWDGGDRHSIRLAYYRRRCREDVWEYASQMTVDSEWQTIKSLLELTLAKSAWFSDTPRISN